MDSFLRDLKFGARLLWKDKSFAATVLLTLALCIGGNVTIFSIVYSVLLRPLAVPEGDRILLMYNAYPRATASAGGSGGGRGATAVPDYYDRLEAVDVFEEQALFRRQGSTIGEQGNPERVLGSSVTPSFFRLLRVAPQQGRIFVEEEGEVGNERKVLLSDPLWQRLFGGDPAAVGRDLRINGRPYEIVGVAPAGFQFVDTDVMLWVPLAFTDEQKSDQARHSNSWTMIGRLAPGATLEQAQAQIDALNTRNLDRVPQFRQLLIDAGFHTVVVPLQDELVRNIRRVLYLLWGGVVFVLLIGCVNIANLMLIRSNGRLKELGMRYALGAGKWRVARQLLTESALLTVLGGLLGLLVGALGLDLLSTLGADALPRGSEIGMDGVIVALTLGLGGLIGIVVGLVPVVNVAMSDLHETLRQETRSGTSGPAARTFRNALVAAQISIAFVLLIGATLLFVSFQRILEIDPGFTPDHLLTATVSLPSVRYSEADQLRTFAQRAIDRIGRLPGVVEVGMTSSLPFGGSYSNSVIQAEGYTPAPGESLIAPSRLVVDAGYFDAMGIPLVEGRFFDGRDTADSMPAAIIDQRLARKFWPDRSALGGRLFAEILDEEDRTYYTVVGVVADSTLWGLVDVPEPIGAYHFVNTQQPLRSPRLAIRTAGEPIQVISAVRAEITALDPELPLFDVRTMEERIANGLVARRTPMLLSMTFALLALFLSAVGIYGVLAYRVTQRTREIGIRIALGSTARQVFTLVLAEGLVVLSVGLGLGIAGAFALRHAVASQLYGVEPMDPIVLASVIGLLGAVALLACALPARRATRIDPVSALNYE